MTGRTLGRWKKSRNVFFSYRNMISESFKLFGFRFGFLWISIHLEACRSWLRNTVRAGNDLSICEGFFRQKNECLPGYWATFSQSSGIICIPCSGYSSSVCWWNFFSFIFFLLSLCRGKMFSFFTVRKLTCSAPSYGNFFALPWFHPESCLRYGGIAFVRYITRDSFVPDIEEKRKSSPASPFVTVTFRICRCCFCYFCCGQAGRSTWKKKLIWLTHVRSSK